MSKKPLKSTLTVGGATFVSRIFGYVRDAVVFIVFGANAGTDAFFVAFRVPNFLRRLFAEGAFSQAFVPVMAEHLHQGEDSFHRLINHVTGLLSVVLLVITAVGVLASPWLIVVFAPGFDDPQQEFLASELLKITFPYLLFISLTALAGSILNIRQKFAVPALTPVLLNFSLIAAALWLAPRMQQPIYALAWGVFIAGVVQLLFQIPFLLKARGMPVPKLHGAVDGVRKILRLMLPAIFGSSVVQLNILINTMIASFLAVGSISWLYISDRFVELPLALFGIATATVILPMLSRQYVAKHPEQFNQTLQWAMKISLLIALPAMFGLIALAAPILSSLVQYRQFSVFDTQMATMSLTAYALGLPAYIYIKILAPGFYARQNTKTPVKIGIIAMLLSITLSLSFVWLWHKLELPGAHTGLALATAIAAYLNAGLLFITLKRTQVLSSLADWLTFFIKVLISSLIMFAVLWYLVPELMIWSQWHAWMRLSSLLGYIALGAGIYVLLLLLMGLRPRQFRFPVYE